VDGGKSKKDSFVAKNAPRNDGVWEYMDKLFCVYVMTNGHNTVLYVGMSSDLKGRVWQHKNGVVDSFSKRYKTTKLVYYEVCPGAEGAILREKQLKGGSRAKKIALIESTNPTWRDLSDEL
jgi:putative endonuclease